jgi:hypothetical protein
MRRLTGSSWRAGCAVAAVCSTTRGVQQPPPTLRVPPRLPSARPGSKLPPPPPLSAASASRTWKSPSDILGLLVNFIPTFYVPVTCVAAILSDEVRLMCAGRGKFTALLKRYPFFFDIRMVDGLREDVKLRADVNHPRRGAADEKFVMTDVGDVVRYTAKPEFVTSLEPLDSPANQPVAIKPNVPPPSVHVRLEERVPVVDRLRALIPTDFTAVDSVEEKIPEDVLFHPYFDCQGGLPAIAGKFPEHFQLVNGEIRLRPPHISPLALAEYTFDDSPLPMVIAKVRAETCVSDVPQWISVTTLYEMLNSEEKRAVKRQFKSFSSFLRMHGKSLSISLDMLKVAHWVAPTSGRGSPDSTTSPSGVQVRYTPTHLLNELFDKFPANRTLNMVEVVGLLSPTAQASLPRKTVSWLHASTSYFVVENPDEPNPTKIRVRRASDRAPLDMAVTLYPLIPEEGIEPEKLVEQVGDASKGLLKQIGIENVVNSLPDWLEIVVTENTTTPLMEAGVHQPSSRRIKRRKSVAELEHAILTEESKLAASGEAAEDLTPGPAEGEDEFGDAGRFTGTMSRGEEIASRRVQNAPK